MNKSRALCLSITSGLVIACGILIGVLMYMLSVTVTEGLGISFESKYDALKLLVGPYWLVGIVFVLPGVLCFIAAFIQNKCFYITSCIIAIIFVAIVGLAIFIFGYPLAIVIIAFYKFGENCNDDVGKCVCTVDGELIETPFIECPYMEDTLNLFMAVAGLFVLAWVFLLAAFVITTVYACRSKQTSGAVYTPAQQPMLTH